MFELVFKKFQILEILHDFPLILSRLEKEGSRALPNASFENTEWFVM